MVQEAKDSLGARPGPGMVQGGGEVQSHQRGPKDARPHDSGRITPPGGGKDQDWKARDRSEKPDPVANAVRDFLARRLRPARPDRTGSMPPTLACRSRAVDHLFAVRQPCVAPGSRWGPAVCVDPLRSDDPAHPSDRSPICAVASSTLRASCPSCGTYCSLTQRYAPTQRYTLTRRCTTWDVGDPCRPVRGGRRNSDVDSTYRGEPRPGPDEGPGYRFGPRQRVTSKKIGWLSQTAVTRSRFIAGLKCMAAATVWAAVSSPLYPLDSAIRASRTSPFSST